MRRVLLLLVIPTILSGCAFPHIRGVEGSPPMLSEPVEQRKFVDTIFFAFNKSTLSAEARGTLERQAEFTIKYPRLTFIIAGNCDDRGTREYNLALGERRAAAAKSGLVALGVDPHRLKTVSYGKERPSVTGENEAAWAQNRNAIMTIGN